MQLTLKSQETLREIVNMLTDLGDNFEIFHIYQTMFTEDSNMSRALVDIFADVVQFGVYTIQFLRRHPVGKPWYTLLRDTDNYLITFRKHGQAGLGQCPK